MFDNTYKIDTVCWNCDSKQRLKIKKGMKVDEMIHSDNAMCGNCGNKTLMTYDDWSLKKRMEQNIGMCEAHESNEFNHIG